MAALNQVERIRQMEQHFQQFQTLVAQMEQLNEQWQKLLPAIDKLKNYYQTEWQADYHADELGNLPNDLVRGVLSQDGLYDCFTDYEQLATDLLSLAKQSFESNATD